MRLLKGWGKTRIILTTERKHKALIVCCYDENGCELDLFTQTPTTQKITVALSISSREELEVLMEEFSEYDPIQNIWDSKFSIHQDPLYFGSGKGFQSREGTRMGDFSIDIYFTALNTKIPEIQEKILSLPRYKVCKRYYYNLTDYFILR